MRSVHVYIHTVWVVSVLSVLDMVPVLAVLDRAVISCPYRVGVIRASLGFAGLCCVVGEQRQQTCSGETTRFVENAVVEAVHKPYRSTERRKRVRRPVAVR